MKIPSNMLIKMCWGRTLDSESADDKAEALNYWVAQLDNKEVSKGQFILNLIDVAKGCKDDPVWGWVSKYLQARERVGEIFFQSDLGNIADPAQAIAKGKEVLAGITPSEFKGHPDANPSVIAQQAV